MGQRFLSIFWIFQTIPTILSSNLFEFQIFSFPLYNDAYFCYVGESESVFQKSLKLSVKTGLNSRDMEHLRIPLTVVGVYIFPTQATWA